MGPGEGVADGALHHTYWLGSEQYCSVMDGLHVCTVPTNRRHVVHDPHRGSLTKHWSSFQWYSAAHPSPETAGLHVTAEFFVHGN